MTSHKKKYHPPKLARQFLLWFLKSELAEEVLGDLEEKYHLDSGTSPFHAKLNYWYQVLNYLRPFAIRSSILSNIKPVFMLKSYFKIATRHLTYNSFFTLINILGLAIGTTACLLIFQFIHFERSYDQFLEDAENIYRVPIRYSEGFSSHPAIAVNHPGVGPTMKREFPEVKEYVRIANPNKHSGKIAYSYTKADGQKISSIEDKILVADSSFFDIFSFQFVAGDRHTALNEPKSIVLSSSLAKKFFGNNNPIGETIKSSESREYKVTGIFEDLPVNSHFSFDGLISLQTFTILERGMWSWPLFYTYVKLKDKSDPKAVEEKFPAMTEKYMSEIHKLHDFNTYFSLQPILDIHLKSNFPDEMSTPGNQRVVYFLSILGIFILIIAWINYMNLSTSKSIERAKEVGIRKVIGALKGQLVIQFLIEAMVVSAISIILGFLMAKLLLPQFSELVGKDIGDSILSFILFTEPLFWLVLVGAILAGGLAAGFYPALVLSSFLPVQVLKGRFLRSSHGVSMRRIMVGIQFVISILLIGATILITKQISFMNQEELGYNKDQILVATAPLLIDSSMMHKINVFNTEILQLNGINNVTKSSQIPGKVIPERNGVRNFGQDIDVNKETFYKCIDDQFLDAFDIQLLSGRNFIAMDSSLIRGAQNNKVLINEKLSVTLGYNTPEDAIGKSVIFHYGPMPNEHKAEIIGVVANYHQRSLKEDYDPILYYFPSYNTFYTNWDYFSFNISTKDWSRTISQIEEKYTMVFPGNPFDYFFLDEFFDRQYRSDQRFSKVSRAIAGFAIFVACLGFLGLSTLILIQRTKEIGVRKILGANPFEIMVLVTKDFVKLLFLANIIALPLIWYFGRKWLNNFAFNTGIGWEVYVLPILFMLIIVLGIVSIQIYRTSVLNPVNSLKAE